MLAGNHRRERTNLSIEELAELLEDYGYQMWEALRRVQVFTASSDSQFWLNQAYAPFGTAVAFGLTAVKVPDSYAYYTAGQIFGIVESLKGAAGYEVLIERPGIAAKGMDAQSIAHLLYIALVILGNVAFYMGCRKH